VDKRQFPLLAATCVMFVTLSAAAGVKPLRDGPGAMHVARIL
jgi:hypothetical protein